MCAEVSKLEHGLMVDWAHESQVEEPECVHSGWPHSDTAASTLSIAGCSSMTPGQSQHAGGAFNRE